MDPYVIFCYSYKGGAGRSTAAVNIASALYKLDKSVCLIDLDIESPGLHEIFNRLDKFEDIKSMHYIQDLLRTKKTNEEGEVVMKEPVPLSKFKQEGIINLQPALKESFGKEIIKNDKKYLFIPASPEPKDAIVLKGKHPETQLNNLIKMLGEEKDIDYVVVDGASGLRSTSVTGMVVADLILILFRWSIQQVSTTIRSVNWIKRIQNNMGLIEADYKLIPSAVPDIDNQIPIDPDDPEDIQSKKKDLKEELNIYYDEAINIISNRLPVDPEELKEYQIPMDPLLTWKEKITVFDDKADENPYTKIAKRSIELSDNSG